MSESYEFKSSAVAAMPTRYGIVECQAFSDPIGGTHLALWKGSIETQACILRIQSHCLTSTAFGSRLCDCARQIDDALRMMQDSPPFLMIYLNQEARGHGLFAKINVLSFIGQVGSLQEAQRLAGVAEDRRDYSMIPGLLLALGARSPIRLLTGSRARVTALQDLGVQIDKVISFDTRRPDSKT